MSDLAAPWQRGGKAYYNELDPFKAEVLREAIKAGAIAPGDVDGFLFEVALSLCFLLGCLGSQ